MSRATHWARGVLVFAAIAGPRPALAVPSAANSFVPSHILLVGRSSDLADTSSGAFSIVVRDVANVPMAGSVVEVRILNCPGARLSSTSYDAGSTIRCGTAGVLRTTNLFGEVRMTLVGGGTAGGPAGAGPCVQVFASNVPLGTASLAYLDLDGASGMGTQDLSLWLTDVGSGEDIGRSDYDGSGTLGANDLSLWLTLWGVGGSAQSAAAYCP
jgi:hypothetical protein